VTSLAIYEACTPVAVGGTSCHSPAFLFESHSSRFTMDLAETKANTYAIGLFFLLIFNSLNMKEVYFTIALGLVTFFTIHKVIVKGTRMQCVR
jgi:hypothetical protein